MEYKILGNSNLNVSRLGFGCVQLGLHQWGDVKEEEIGQALNIALDEGVNFFDTSDVYGIGKSEENLQKYLGNKLKDCIVASKFGVRIIDGKTVHDNSSEWIEKAVELSLKRLKIDAISLYQLHAWDQVTPLSATFEQLEKLVASGKIRYYGVTNIPENEWNKIDVIPKNLVSFSLQYSLANRTYENYIRHVKAQGVGFLSWGSLGEGILSGKYRVRPEFSDADRRSRGIYDNFHGEKFTENMKIVDKLEAISKNYPNKTIPQVAIRWILDYLDTEVVLVGIKNEKQLLDNLGAINWQLNTNDINALTSVASKL